MDDKINLLITLTDGDGILQCALKLKGDALTQDEQEYCLEPENRAKIASLLPLHVRSCGQICKVEEIFEIKDLTK